MLRLIPEIVKLVNVRVFASRRLSASEVFHRLFLQSGLRHDIDKVLDSRDSWSSPGGPAGFIFFSP
jgi:hypothetical protein